MNRPTRWPRNSALGTHTIKGCTPWRSPGKPLGDPFGNLLGGFPGIARGVPWGDPLEDPLREASVVTLGQTLADPHGLVQGYPGLLSRYKSLRLSQPSTGGQVWERARPRGGREGAYPNW